MFTICLPTVEKRVTQGVLLPILLKMAALQYLVMSWVTSKYPNAPPPLACTTLSGILSLSKWLISSRNWTSCSRTGPLGPTVMVDVFVSTGHPDPVVRTSGFLIKKIEKINLMYVTCIIFHEDLSKVLKIFWGRIVHLYFDNKTFWNTIDYKKKGKQTTTFQSHLDSIINE